MRLPPAAVEFAVDGMAGGSTDSEVLLVFPCGFSLSRLRGEAGLLAALPGWDDLAAVRGRRVYLADGNQLFNRPGPRLLETLEAVAEILHPELFHFGHEGSLWQNLAHVEGRAGR